MSQEELNKYRFGSGEEPTEEMLAQVMEEVAQYSVESSNKVTAEYFENMRNNIMNRKSEWENRINVILNG